MKNGLHPEPTVFVIFGAGGDLAWRKLVPALYNTDLCRIVVEKPFGNDIAQDGHNWVSPTYLKCRDDTATCKVSMEPY